MRNLTRAVPNTCSFALIRYSLAKRVGRVRSETIASLPQRQRCASAERNTTL